MEEVSGVLEFRLLRLHGSDPAAAGQPPLSILSATHAPSSPGFHPQCLQGEMCIPLPTLVLPSYSFLHSPQHLLCTIPPITVRRKGLWWYLLSKSSPVAVASPLPESAVLFIVMGRGAVVLGPEGPV